MKMAHFKIFFNVLTILNRRNEVQLSLDSQSFTNTLIFNEILESILQENIQTI